MFAVALLVHRSWSRGCPGQLFPRSRASTAPTQQPEHPQGGGTSRDVTTAQLHCLSAALVDVAVAMFATTTPSQHGTTREQSPVNFGTELTCHMQKCSRSCIWTCSRPGTSVNSHRQKTQQQHGLNQIHKQKQHQQRPHEKE